MVFNPRACCCWITGQPADSEHQSGHRHDSDASVVPFGSPYTTPQDFARPYTPPHDPFHVPQPLQSPVEFASAYNTYQEASPESFHQAGPEHGYAHQYGHQPYPSHPVFGGPSIPGPPFAPAYPPSHSASAGGYSPHPHYDQFHLAGGSHDCCTSSAGLGQKRNFASLYETAPRGPCRDSPAPQPVYAPSSPGYAPSGPGAVPAEFSKPGHRQAAGNQTTSLGLQGHPEDAPNNFNAQAGSLCQWLCS